MSEIETVKVELLKDIQGGYKKGEIIYVDKKDVGGYIKAGIVKIVGGEPPKSKVKDFLKEESQEQESENYTKNKINWIPEDNDFFDSWDKTKGHLKKLLGHHEELGTGDKFKTEFFFLAHSKDSIKGKPQLIENVQKRIPLIREIIKTIKGTKEVEEHDIIKYITFDERYDKRYDGYQKDCFAQDFWTYRIIAANGKEYYVLTQQQLPNEVCALKGMLIELDDFAEFSKSMKIKSLSRIFIMKEYKASVSIISKEQLIKYTKTKGLTEKGWLSLLAYHPVFNNFNRFPDDVEKLKSAFVLSGKKDGYNLHLWIFGPTGTKKTVGHIETMSYKFSEEPIICEGANSRIKALSPSFKEKPANIGYLAKSDRMGWVDEIGKMVEFEVAKAHQSVTNVLGELNFLLEQKRRMVGSGNDNDVNVQATAKFLFVTNPVSGRDTIYNHVGLIDPTTMSRMLCWVQDEAEQKFVLDKTGVENPPNTKTSIRYILNDTRNTRKYKVLYMCSGDVRNIDSMEIEDFLTLFDSCNSFVCDVDLDEVERLVSNTVMLAREPMKSSVWKPRARHHTFLLIDGLVKHRCLFKDYDSSFKPKKEDYVAAERILVRMVKSWDTELSPKEDY